MTRDEFGLYLDSIESRCEGDPEREHSGVDKLLIRALRELGWDSEMDRIEKMQEGWWWA